MDDFDVVIVGARCAGSALGASLAAAGISVCVLDRAGFPSETPSTHVIQPSGASILDRLGVLAKLAEVSPAIDSVRLRFGEAQVDLGGAADRLGPGLCVRRTTLDGALLEAASSAGAEVRTRTPVTGVIVEDGRVVGVETPSGRIRAALVVGADGATSTVARLVGAAEYNVTEPGRLFLWGYIAEAPVPPGPAALWIGKVGAVGYLACPTDAGLYMAAVTIDVDRRDEVLADRETSYRRMIGQWPELAAIVEGGVQEGRLRAMTRWHGFFRESAGRGWALVGDAGHFKDPTPGQGISDALRQSSRLAATIISSLPEGSARVDAALQKWWRWRDDDAWEMYWFAHDLGAPGETPLVMREVQRRLTSDAAMAERLLLILNHDTAPSTLVRPAAGLRAVATALRRNGGRRRQVLAEARDLATADRRRARSRPVP